MLLEILTLLGAHTMRQLLKRNSCKSLDLNFSSLFLKWGKATSYKKGKKKMEKLQVNLQTSKKPDHQYKGRAHEYSNNRDLGL